MEMKFKKMNYAPVLLIVLLLSLFILFLLSLLPYSSLSSNYFLQINLPEPEPEPEPVIEPQPVKSQQLESTPNDNASVDDPEPIKSQQLESSSNDNATVDDPEPIKSQQPESAANGNASVGDNVSVDIEVKSRQEQQQQEKKQYCDLFSGRWVRDEENRYPLYRPGSCPYVDEAFDCQPNGRPDSAYLKWRWQPDSCDLPRFNATDFLTRLRGKRLMFVGDSMNRNQFESMLCLLREGIDNKSTMYEINGHRISKGRGYFVFKILDYNCTVSFVRSHFLVREGVRVNGQGNSNPTLSIDRIDKSSGKWRRADILVFNTGHWWAHGKTARGKNYYKEGDHLYPQFDSVEAYRRALKTWGTWIDEHVIHEKQLVFYRGYSSAHFRGGDWDSGGQCDGETEPISSGNILNQYPVKMKIVEEVIREMKTPVRLLNVTRLTNFRKDAHPSVYGKAGKKVSLKRQDCSHWCLPGVPDAWNELIYATLFSL